ncbi:ABC transporter permease [Chitinophaga jiangningensis]|nr:ABC transporter permease [Chitinophaga jiangningensis]
MDIRYLKIAWRNLRKDRFYSLLNVTGLAVAMAAFLLIIQYVKFERSYEKFYPNADNIWRVTLNLYKDGAYVTTDCETHPPLPGLLKQQMPEVKDFVRIQRIGESEVTTPSHQSFLENGLFAADPSVFSIFPQHFIAGDPAKALRGPLEAVLTASTARRYFGDADPIGKSLLLRGQTLTVTGVIADMPPNTHLRMNVLMSMHIVETFGVSLESWNGNNNYTYLQMQPGTSLEAFNAKLAAFSAAHPRLKDKRYVAETIGSIHLFSKKSFEPDVNGDAQTVRFLQIVAFLLLIIGTINYVNLTTARSASRLKEAGIKKILGASRWTVLRQFLAESLLINLMAFILSLVLIQAALPFYKNIVGEGAAAGIFSSASFWLTCVALFIANGLLSGIYPAYALSSANMVGALTRSFTGNLQGGGLRKILVVSQFAIASVVLIASLVMYKQLSFMQQQSLGMNTDQVLILRAPNLQNDTTSYTAFKQELMQLAGVQKVSLAGCMPGLGLETLSTTYNVTRLGDTNPASYNYYLYGIDADFIPVLDLQLLAGRNFVPGRNNHLDVIINEEASKRLGFATPEAAIGQKINFWGDKSTVVGVMKDFHQRSLKESLLPMIHPFMNNDASYYGVKMSSGDIRKTLTAIEAAWQQTFRDHPFQYFFMDDAFNQQYQADSRLAKLVNIFSVFTLFITCLGLMGLAAFNVSRRTREIGIRKILGSSVTGIISMLTKDFIRLVFIAIVIASPVAWWAMNAWLQDFVYRISIPWWVFIVTGGLMLLVAVCTIGLQSVKTAMMNPVKSLRSD